MVGNLPLKQDNAGSTPVSSAKHRGIARVVEGYCLPSRQPKGSHRFESDIPLQTKQSVVVTGKRSQERE